MQPDASLIDSRFRAGIRLKMASKVPRSSTVSQIADKGLAHSMPIQFVVCILLAFIPHS